jgi:hypothetical protein
LPQSLQNNMYLQGKPIESKKERKGERERERKKEREGERGREREEERGREGGGRKRGRGAGKERRERLGDDEIRSQRIIYTLNTYTYTLVDVVYTRTIPCASTHGTDINEGEPGIRA